jgi:hypothetical protein
MCQTIFHNSIVMYHNIAKIHNQPTIRWKHFKKTHCYLCVAFNTAGKNLAQVSI